MVIYGRAGCEISVTRPRLLVVGGSGFIGRHVVARGVQLGWEVISLSLRAVPNASLSGARHASADIADGCALKAALGNAAFEFVVNCGGYIDHTPFSRAGRRVLETHFGGVQNLVAVLNREALRGFVNFGSSDEYGDSAAPQRESQRETPISPYAQAKTAATHFLQMLSRTEGFPAVSLRLFLTYGPGQDDRRFLPQIIRGCLSGSSFPTSGGEQLRDFCFVQDTVSAVFAALDNPAARGEVINIASGRPVSIRNMIETVRDMIGQGDPRFGEIAYRPSENMVLFADVSKASDLLGWTPRIPLTVGLHQTIEWFRGQS